MLLLRLAAGLLLLYSTNLPAKDKESPAPLDLGSRLELFVDGFLIESMEGLEQRLHHPVSAGKILTLDKPWEGITCDYQVVFKDGDLYRMYYRGSSHEGYTIPSFLKPGETVVPVHPQFALYAESPDGLTWTRPELEVGRVRRFQAKQHRPGGRRGPQSGSLPGSKPGRNRAPTLQGGRFRSAGQETGAVRVRLTRRPEMEQDPGGAHHHRRQVRFPERGLLGHDPE